MRGEHRLASIPSALMRGSSPHARGARARPVYEGLVPGIIPACAGSTCLSCSIAGTSRDHPRMRGEHSSVPPPMVVARGSSPHARGAQTAKSFIGLADRIIPACAGSTLALLVDGFELEDHPRMRGEHNYQLFLDELDEGSSPHARGALPRGERQDCARGIIPACAGSTSLVYSPSCPAADHPRMRGEHTSRPARLVNILA